MGKKLSPLALASLTVALFSGSANAQWLLNPTTGHEYRLGSSHNTWTSAQNEATQYGGYLVSINDAAEQQWVWDNFSSGIGDLAWLGLVQDSSGPEPAGGWRWASGEPVTYTNWWPGPGSYGPAPNDPGGSEDWGGMYGPANTSPPGTPGTWQDTTHSHYLNPVAIIERPAAPQPRPQTVYLAWDTPAPFELKDRGWSGWKPDRSSETPASGTDITGIWRADGINDSDSAREWFRSQVQSVFSGSNVDHVTFVNGTPSDPSQETVVYLSDLQSGWNGPGGQAVSRIDRCNSDLSGEAIVYLHSNIVSDSRMQDVETIAHEVGHLLGLIHVDPQITPDTSVMDYDTIGQGDQPMFFDEKTPAVIFKEEDDGTMTSRPLGWNGIGLYHNPQYHLRRWIDGETHDSLVAAGLEPGLWDVEWSIGRTAITMSLGELSADRYIYDVMISAVFDEDVNETVAYFDSILLSDLEALEFEVPAGARLVLDAASQLGGEVEIVLATGDPSLSESVLIDPVEGLLVAELLHVGQAGAEVLAPVTLDGQYVPEPTSLGLLALGGLGLLHRRRAA